MSTFNIISRDNLNRETEADEWLVIRIPDTPENKAKAQEFCDWLNTFTCNDHGGRYHQIVPHDYRLHRGMLDLI